MVAVPQGVARGNIRMQATADTAPAVEPASPRLLQELGETLQRLRLIVEEAEPEAKPSADPYRHLRVAE